MSDESENPKTTPMDQAVDSREKSKHPGREQYAKTGEDNNLIAETHRALSETTPAPLVSMTMNEIERSLANDVLRSDKQKLETFVLGLNQKQEFGLKNFQKIILPKLTRENKLEMTTGPDTNRVRTFDLRSQSMRMISANAAMGTYQFQRNLMLPYMRKTLSLDYQKVNLLKSVVTGIGSLEAAIVAKLEAIKMNTAATAPHKKSWWKKIKEEVAAKNRSRIATNLSNAQMDAASKLWNKYVTPLQQGYVDAMLDDSKHGGVSRVRRKVTGKLNSLRRSLRDAAQDENTDGSRIGKLKSSSAALASKLLGGALKTEKVIPRLSESNNKLVSKALWNVVPTSALINPLAAPGQGQISLDESSEERAKRKLLVPNISEEYSNPLIAQSRLAESFDEWRREYRSDKDTVIKHLSEINGKMSDCCRDAGGGDSVKKPRGATPLLPKPADKATDAVKEAKPKTPRKPKSIVTKLATPKVAPAPSTKKIVAPKVIRTPKTATTKVITPKVATSPKPKSMAKKIATPKKIINQPKKIAAPKLPVIEPAKKGTPIGALLKKARAENKSKLAKVMDKVKSVTGAVKHRAGLLHTGAIATILAAPKLVPATTVATHAVVSPHIATIRAATDKLIAGTSKKLAGGLSSASRDQPITRQFFTSLFDRLGNKVTSVSKTVEKGNVARTGFEKLQTKWKSIRDRLASSHNRKNSYEDIQAQKEKDRDRNRGLLGKLGDRFGRGVSGIGGNLAAGNLIGALGAGGSALVGMAKDAAVDYIAPKLWRGGKKVVGGAGKLAVKGGKGVFGLARKGIGSLLAREAPEAIEAVAGGKSGLLRGAGKLALGGIKATAAIGAPFLARAGLGATKTAGGVVAGGAKLAGKGLLGGASMLGKGALSVAKAGGSKLLGSAPSLLLKGGKSLLKGVGVGALVGVGADIADGYVDQYSKKGGVANRLGHTATTAASWGATGAAIGSIVPGLGTAAGAIIGGAAGAIYANSDLVISGMKKAGNLAMTGLGMLGTGAITGSKFLWKGLFGSKAKFDPMGKVTEKAQSSLIGNVNSLIFGRNARLSKSGEVVQEGTTGLIPFVGLGLRKFFFGTADKDGKIDPKSSMLSRISDSISSTLDNFKKYMGDLGTKLKDGAAGIGSGISNLASSAAGAVSSGASYVAKGASAAVGAVESGASAVYSAGSKLVGGAILSMKDALTKILQYEGGSKIISDTGGLTKYGISAKGNPGVDIKNLTEDQARAIYDKKYAAPLGLSKYSPAVAFVALDASVNQGPGYAKKLLAQGGGDAMKMIALRRQMYAGLAQKNPGKYGKYLKGWNNRMDRLTKDIGGAAGASAALTSKSPSAVAASAAAAPKATKTAGATGTTSGNISPAFAKAIAANPKSALTAGSAAGASAGSAAAAAFAAPSVAAKTTKAPTPTPAPPKLPPVTAAAAPKTVATPQPSAPVAAPVKAEVAYTPPVSTYTPPPPAPKKAVTPSGDFDTLIKAMGEQTGAIRANTDALLQHKGTMTNLQNANLPTNQPPPSAPAMAVIPIPMPAPQNNSSPDAISMSMAKTSIRSGAS